jgi:acetoin utilization protein AcuB
MLVSEWMSPNPKTVSPKTPVMEAMQVLREGGFRRLPVVDGDKLVGIVTDRDLKDATPSKATTLSIYELNYLLTKLTVKEVMKTRVLTVGSDDPVERAALLMSEHKVSGLPVVEGQRLVGIITISDLLEAFVAVLGLREGGYRVTVSLPDEPGVLASVAAAAAPANIVAVVTAGVKEGQHRRVVLRVVGESADAFEKRLKEAGVDVVDVHEA